MMRTKIIQNALKMFISEGVKSVTMDGIASTMGISKRTIYENFKNKNELVESCLVSLSQQHEECAKDILYADNKNAVDIFLEFLVKGMGDSKYVFKFISDVRRYYHDEYARIVVQLNKKKKNQLTDLIIQGIAEGYFREDTNIELLMFVFSTQMEIIFSPTLYVHHKFSETELFQSMIINFTRGISTKKGFDRIEELLDEFKGSGIQEFKN